MRTHGTSFPFSVFGPSPCPGHYPGRWATMASADFCPITLAGCPARRYEKPLLALLSMIRSHPVIASGCAWTLFSRWPVPGSFAERVSSHVGQISPDKDVNCRYTTAAFTLSPESGASSCCADLPGDWALYAVSIRRLIALHSGFLQTVPRGNALAVG